MKLSFEPSGALRSQRHGAAVNTVAEALDSAARNRARALVMIVAASDEDEVRTRRLDDYLGAWERAAGDRVRCEALGDGRHVVALAPIGFASQADDIRAQVMRTIDGRACPLEREAAPRFVCGVAMYPEDGVTPSALMAHAIAALEAAGRVAVRPSDGLARSPRNADAALRQHEAPAAAAVA